MRIILLILFSASLVGCISKGSQSTVISTLSRDEVLLPSTTAGDGYEMYVTKLSWVLQKYGFTPVTSGSPRYSVQYYVGGAFGMTSTISLLENGVPVIVAESYNPGVGTWVARPLVRETLFLSTLKKFESQLDGLMNSR